jgi:hypothetical protein
LTKKKAIAIIVRIGTQGVRKSNRGEKWLAAADYYFLVILKMNNSYGERGW